jgi:hypothetical protein
MRRLAFAFHSGQVGETRGGREVPYEQVETILAQMMPELGREPADGKRLLRRLIERSGILTERKRGALAFAHLTFQEYFAAHFLAIGETRGHLEYLLDEDRLRTDWWREVVLLYSGLVSDSSDVTSRIMAAPSGDLFDENVRLAGLALSEAIALRNKGLRDQVLRNLLTVRSLGESKVDIDAIPPEGIEYLLDWTRSSQWLETAARKNIKHLISLGEIDDLVKIVESALARSAVLERQAALLSVLHIPGVYVSQGMLESVLQATSDREPDIRRAGIRALPVVAQFAPGRAAQAFCAALADDASGVSRSALSAMSRCKEVLMQVSTMTDQLIGVLSSESDDASARVLEALDVLAGPMTPVQLAEFVDVMGRKSDAISGRAAVVVASVAAALTDVECVDVLVDKSQDRRQSVRILVGAALGALGSDFVDDRVINTCILLAEDRHREVRSAALSGLKKLSVGRWTIAHETVLRSLEGRGLPSRTTISILEHLEWSHAPLGTAQRLINILQSRYRGRSALLKALVSVPEESAVQEFAVRRVKAWASIGLGRKAALEFFARRWSLASGADLTRIADKAIASVYPDISVAGAGLLAKVAGPEECLKRRAALYRLVRRTSIPVWLESVTLWTLRWTAPTLLVLDPDMLPFFLEFSAEMTTEHPLLEEDASSSRMGIAQCLLVASQAADGRMVVEEVVRQFRAGSTGRSSTRVLLRFAREAGLRDLSGQVFGSLLSLGRAVTARPWVSWPPLLGDIVKTLKIVTASVPRERIVASIMQFDDDNYGYKIMIQSILADRPECCQSEAGARVILRLLDDKMPAVRSRAVQIASRMKPWDNVISAAIRRRLLDEERTVRDAAWDAVVE